MGKKRTVMDVVDETEVSEFSCSSDVATHNATGATITKNKNGAGARYTVLIAGNCEAGFGTIDESVAYVRSIELDDKKWDSLCK